MHNPGSTKSLIIAIAVLLLGLVFLGLFNEARTATCFSATGGGKTVALTDWGECRRYVQRLADLGLRDMNGRPVSLAADLEEKLNSTVRKTWLYGLASGICISLGSYLLFGLYRRRHMQGDAQERHASR